MNAGCFLPYEVLANIFRYLPLADRKNVRRTCHLWNDACHHPMIVKYEKFVFHPGVIRGNMQGTGVCITHCKTLRSDFEFYGLSETQLAQIPSIMWKECGDRITSLYLKECAMDEEAVKNVLLYCPNLISLRICSLLLSDSWRSGWSLSIAFDDLIDLGVTRTNIISFELYTWAPMPEEDVAKLFQILPNIRTFRHGCWNSDTDEETIEYYEMDDSGRCCYYLPEELLRPVPIENFTYNWWLDTEWLRSFNPDLGLKFKELELSIKSREEDEEEDEEDDEEYLKGDTLVNFFSSQIELEKLTFRMPDEIDDMNMDFFTYFLFGLLKKSSKLKKLTLQLNYLNFSDIEFMEFLNLISDFEYLDISPIKVFGSLPSPSPKFINLKTLKLGCAIDGRTVIQILERCSCLSVLHLNNSTITNKILQTIFEHHTKLKELYLYRVWGNCTAAGFTGLVDQKNQDSSCHQPVGYSFARLQDLERLTLTNGTTYFPSQKLMYKVFDGFLSEFNFPRLKYFKINDDLSSENESKLLETLSTMAPCLESLEMRPNDDGINLTLLIKNCNKMKRLKCIKFVSACLSMELYEQLFTECPSLVNVFVCRKHQCQNSFYFKNECFFYDRVSKSLISVPSE